MLALRLIRLALVAFGLLFGSLGTLLLYLSLTARPAFSASSVVFLGATAVITWALQQSN